MDGKGYIWMVVSSPKKKTCASEDQLKLDQSTLNIEIAIPTPSMEKNYDVRVQNMFVFEGWGYNLAPSLYILVQSNHPCWWLRQAPASNIFKSWGKQIQTKSYGFRDTKDYLTILTGRRGLYSMWTPHELRKSPEIYNNPPETILSKPWCPTVFDTFCLEMVKVWPDVTSLPWWLWFATRGMILQVPLLLGVPI